MRFDWPLAFARMANAVLASLPVGGAGSWAMGDMQVAAWTAGAAAVGAFRTDLDAWVKARSARELANIDKREAVAQAKEDVRAETPQQVEIVGSVEIKPEGE